MWNAFLWKDGMGEDSVAALSVSVPREDYRYLVLLCRGSLGNPSASDVYCTLVLPNLNCIHVKEE